MPHDSDSATRRDAEAGIVSGVSAQPGTLLVKRRVDLPGGACVEVDSVAPDQSVLVEAFARVGPMKDGQKRKVALDVLKLITVQRTYPEAQLVLAFCDARAMNSLTGWLGEAIARWNLDPSVAPLYPELRNRLLEVQARQYR